MIKTCDIVGCDETFEKSDRHRMRITKMQSVGEKVAWICPDHGLELEEKIKFRGD